jgi:ribosomal protein L40E
MENGALLYPNLACLNGQDDLSDDFQVVSRELINGFCHSVASIATKDGCDEWVCIKCMLENPLESTNCLACGFAKASSDSSSWSCAKCTLINLDSTETCSACHEPNPQQRDAKRCRTCTFENKPKLSACEMCGTLLEPTSTSSASRKRTPLARPDSGRASVGSVKQESELTDQLRKIEETEAMEVWQNIVDFCAAVSRNVFQAAIIDVISIVHFRTMKTLLTIPSLRLRKLYFLIQPTHPIIRQVQILFFKKHNCVAVLITALYIGCKMASTAPDCLRYQSSLDSFSHTISFGYISRFDFPITAPNVLHSHYCHLLLFSGILGDCWLLSAMGKYL